MGLLNVTYGHVDAEVAVPPSAVLSLHHLAMPFDQLIFGKIIKIAATRGQILRLKCTKFYFGWGSVPDPAGGAYTALSQCPRPIIVY